MSSLLRNVLPELAEELADALRSENETDLLTQVDSLRIVERCRCADHFCATMYTAPPPDGAYGPGHECVPLDTNAGELILDLVDRKIVCIEVLNRDDVRKTLLELLP